MSEEKQQLAAGVHKTKVTGYGVRETKNGGAQLWIKFANGACVFQSIGNETGDKFASESLVLCGFKGDSIADLFDDDALDLNKEIEIFVQYKPDHVTGEPRADVRINNPNKGKMKGDLCKSEAISLFKKLRVSLKKDLIEAKKEIGEVEREEQTKITNDFSEDTEDIPF